MRKIWQKDKELLSQSLSEQGNQEEAEQEASFASRTSAQRGVEGGVSLSLSCQPSSCGGKGSKKPKPKAAQAGARWETVCSWGWIPEAPTLGGTMNQKKSLRFPVPGECKQMGLGVEQNNGTLEALWSASGFQSQF